MTLTDLYKIISQKPTRVGHCDRCGYNRLGLWLYPATNEDGEFCYCLDCWKTTIYNLQPKGTKTCNIS